MCVVIVVVSRTAQRAARNCLPACPDGAAAASQAEVAKFLIDGTVARHAGFAGLPTHRLTALAEVTFPCFFSPDEEIVTEGEEPMSR